MSMKDNLNFTVNVCCINISDATLGVLNAGEIETFSCNETTAAVQNNDKFLLDADGIKLHFYFSISRMRSLTDRFPFDSAHVRQLHKLFDTRTCHKTGTCLRPSVRLRLDECAQFYLHHMTNHIDCERH